MSKKFYPVLCGGTFYTLLLEAISYSNQKNIKGISQYETLKQLIKLLKGTNYTVHDKTLKKDASNYKCCKISHSINIPFNDQPSISLLRNKIEDIVQSRCDILDYIANNITSNVNRDNQLWLVKTLIETIYLDQSIEQSRSFYTDICKKTQKKTSLRSHAYILNYSYLIYSAIYLKTKKTMK